MRANYTVNQRNYNQIGFMNPMWTSNQFQSNFSQLYNQANVLNMFSGKSCHEVVNPDNRFNKIWSNSTIAEQATEGTNDSPKSNWSRRWSLSSNMKNAMKFSTYNISEYCTCNIYNNCTVTEETNMYSRSSNDLSMELNKEVMRCQEEDGDFEAINAHFLFPKEKETSVDVKLSSKSSSSKSISTVNSNEKVFNVWKIPKVAFSMVSRKDLARSHKTEDDTQEREEEDLPTDTFDERKAAFGNKRDDLFYKTIGRDVRKYLQECFHSNLGEKSMKQCLKNGTSFIKDVKKLLNKDIVPELSSKADVEKVFVCLATLVSYQGFNPYCDETSKNTSFSIHDSLHNFTKEKLINLWKLPEFQEIFNFYAKRITADKFERFQTHRTMRSNIRGYKYAFNDILKQCQ